MVQSSSTQAELQMKEEVTRLLDQLRIQTELTEEFRNNLSDSEAIVSKLDAQKNLLTDEVCGILSLAMLFCAFSSK